MGGSTTTTQHTRCHSRVQPFCRLNSPNVWISRCDFPLDNPKKHTSSETSATAVFAERMRIALAMIAHVQIVVEKLAGQHGGERRRRQAITYLETLKAISRLLLLACTKEMVLGGGAVSTAFVFAFFCRKACPISPYESRTPQDSECAHPTSRERQPVLNIPPYILASPGRVQCFQSCRTVATQPSLVC